MGTKDSICQLNLKFQLKYFRSAATTTAGSVPVPRTRTSFPLLAFDYREHQTIRFIHVPALAVSGLSSVQAFDTFCSLIPSYARLKSSITKNQNGFDKNPNRLWGLVELVEEINSNRSERGTS